MSNNYIENKAISPIETKYVNDTRLTTMSSQKLIFNFNKMSIDINPVSYQLQLFNKYIDDFNKQLSNLCKFPTFHVEPLNNDDIKQKIETTQDVEQVFDKIMEYVFKDEGGYVNHPKDPGGATNMGVTQNTYNQYCKLNKLPTKNVKNLTKDEAKQVYKQLFWEQSGAKEIAESGDAKLAYVVFDTAIHSGVGKAKKLLAKSNGDANTMIEKRMAMLKSSKNWQTFGRGWTNRLAKVEARLDDFTTSKEYIEYIA